MPRTRLGKWSAGLIVVSLLLFATLALLVSLGQRGGETFFSNPLLGISGLGAAAAAVLASFAGIVAIIKNKERSVFVYIATAIGLYVLVFVLGEILFPH